MLKFGEVLCAAVLSIVVTGASGANLYVTGTNPARMYEVVKPVVGDTVTPSSSSGITRRNFWPLWIRKLSAGLA